MCRDSRPPPEDLPPASGPKERRDEFLRARGLEAEGADDGQDERGDAVDNGCPDDDAVSEADVVEPEEDSMDS
jgi:hypothetical protein